MTVTFDEHEGKTKVTVQHAGLVVDQGELQGWTEMLDRFEDYVANV